MKLKYLIGFFFKNFIFEKVKFIMDTWGESQTVKEKERETKRAIKGTSNT